MYGSYVATYTGDHHVEHFHFIDWYLIINIYSTIPKQIKCVTGRYINNTLPITE